MNSYIMTVNLAIIITFLLILFLIFWIIMIVTCVLITYVVKKDIEKKYKEELHFWPLLFVSEWTFAVKYTHLAGFIILNYLDAKNIISNKLYKSAYNPLIKFKNRYNPLEEKKRNIKICFIHIFSVLMWVIILVILFICSMTIR